MSKIKIESNSGGTGVITLVSPNTNTDRTVTLPDESITLGGGVDGIVSTANATAITIDSSEDVKFHHNFTSASDGAVNGEWRSDWAGLQVGTTSAHYLALRAGNTEQLRIHTDGRGVSQFTAKAWCSCENIGTPSIHDSHNVSSLTDVATGKVRFHYTNNLANTNYVGFSNFERTATWVNNGSELKDKQISSCVVALVENDANVDRANVDMIVFGD